MMTFEELLQLKIRELVDPPGVLFMWATGPKLDEALDLMRLWGFHYRGIAYIWIKTSKEGRIIRGQGVRPSVIKQLEEIVIYGTGEDYNTSDVVLVGSTQKRGRPLEILTESQGQLVFAPRPPRHSQKPVEVYERIEELFGDVPRMEVFARNPRPGWNACGLEAEGAMPADIAVSPRLKESLELLERAACVREMVANLPQE